MTSIKETEDLRARLEKALTSLVNKIGPIQIGSSGQFPYGWRKAAKGRTVWRILEEAINQNLERSYEDYGMSSMRPSASEVSVYDSRMKFHNLNLEAFINVKSAVLGGRTNKDDISKAIRLQEFFAEDGERQLFICSFVIDFLPTMQIKITSVHVMPIAWLPDVYVNPSNNGNLQSSKYKDIKSAIRRTNSEFIAILDREVEVARKKRLQKQ